MDLFEKITRELDRVTWKIDYRQTPPAVIAVHPCVSYSCICMTVLCSQPWSPCQLWTVCKQTNHQVHGMVIFGMQNACQKSPCTTVGCVG